MAGRVTSTSATGPRLRLNIAYSSWDLIWSHVHRVLVINLGMTAANLPLLAALQLHHQPWHRPLLFGPLLLLTGPSLAAAFAYLDQAGAGGPATVRAYVRAYTRLFRPALLVSAPHLLAAVAAVVDIVVLRATPAGPALVPMAGVTAALALLSCVVALAHVAAHGRVGRRVFVLAPFAVVRHGPLALMNLVLLTAGLLLVNQAPLLGLSVLPGCVVCVVWHNCRSLALLADTAVRAGPVAGRSAEAVRVHSHVS
ncbi:hypothetical protein ABZY14_40170 [Streptomyces sp. NPDC006617]|uniref:hypothetical protein n=1 Tax=Streptomyces sp. NPDC006617 TaxID=3155354 RepID=UPI0033BDA6B6